MAPPKKPTLDIMPELEKMRLGVDYRQAVSIRGFSFMLRPLAISEIMTVATSVQTYLASLSEDGRTGLVEQLALAKETLKLASTSDVGASDYQIFDPLLNKMTAAEVNKLYKDYVRITDICDPAFELMTAEQVEKMVDALKKNLLGLTELSFQQSVSILHFLLNKDESPTDK